MPLMLRPAITTFITQTGALALLLPVAADMVACHTLIAIKKT